MMPAGELSAVQQDNTLRIWDMRPFAPANRCMKIFSGHQHSFEKNLLKCAWSPDASQVSIWLLLNSVQHSRVLGKSACMQLPQALARCASLTVWWEVAGHKLADLC